MTSWAQGREGAGHVGGQLQQGAAISPETVGGIMTQFTVGIDLRIKLDTDSWQVEDRASQQQCALE